MPVAQHAEEIGLVGATKKAVHFVHRDDHRYAQRPQYPVFDEVGEVELGGEGAWKIDVQPEGTEHDLGDPPQQRRKLGKLGLRE